MPGVERRRCRFMPVTPSELRRVGSTHANARNRGVPRRRRREGVTDAGYGDDSASGYVFQVLFVAEDVVDEGFFWYRVASFHPGDETDE